MSEPDDAALASVMRKVIAAAGDDLYLDCSMDGSLVIDGWVEGLTEPEMAVVRRVYAAEEQAEVQRFEQSRADAAGLIPKESR